MKDSSWVKKAVLLGAAFFLAVLLVKPVGISTQYSVLSGIIHGALDETVIFEDMNRESGFGSHNEYYERGEGKLAKAIMNPWNYEFVFVLLVPLGAYAAYSMNDKKRESRMSDVGESAKLEKQGFLRLFLPPFLGGFILLYGARMADGCTSGHMMSGMMQGSVSGYIFAAAVFAAAIPIAVLVGKSSRGGK